MTPGNYAHSRKAANLPPRNPREGVAIWQRWLRILDALAVGAYIAGNEDPELGTLLAVELNYAFNVGEHSRLTLILGSEVVSPYDHDPLYVGFSWSWSL